VPENSIAHYRVARPLGHGGMAEVYEAIDTKTQQNVALKLLLPHLAAEEVIRHRFLREAKVGMELDHPGIVKVFDVGEAEDRPYMAMELVEGKTLEELLKTKCFELEQCIGISLKIADALAAAHEKKIVHRDIKPRNIMVTDKGIKIMDFGLARILETSSITDQHEIIGTLYYMSPEQAIGIKVDESSDVFSLGVVLYQMLTGQLPFAGEHPGAVIHAILYSDPLRINELGKSVPLELEQIIFKTLKKKPQLRYRTADELHTDLSKMHYVLQGKPIQLLATEEVFEESPRGIYSRLVGREREMAALEAALEKMMKGESSFFLLSGEAGIGKSRLVWELGRKAKEKQVRYLLGRCLFGERGYPYQPIIEVLRDYFVLKGIKDPDAVNVFIEEKANHLRARINIIHSLLLLQPGQPITLINKEQLWDTISELIKIITHDRPLVLHFDDLHWADTPTLNLLSYLSMTTRQEPVFIVGTYRPEELVAEEGKRHPLQTTLDMMGKENLYHEIKLNRLDKLGTQSVVDSVFADTQFPDNFYDTVYKETEGNPLFVLEVLRYFQDEGFVDKDETGWHLTGELTKISIPDRVTDVIMNRLRRLNQENRDILDVAAVEGYTFQSDTIGNVLGESRLKVLRRLQYLESEHHLIHALEHEYQFDHGKIQETIYNALTPELKEEYHKLTAAYFIKSHGNRDEYAGTIAKHLIAAGQEKESLGYLLNAGKYAQRLYANDEAMSYFDKGIKIFNEYCAQTAQSDHQNFALFLSKGKAEVSELSGRYEAADESYAAMIGLAKDMGDKKRVAAAICGRGNIQRTRANYDHALKYLKRALDMQIDLKDLAGEAQTLRVIGDVHMNMCRYDTALEYYNRTLAVLRQVGDKKNEGWTFLNMGKVHWNRGTFKPYKELVEQALKIFRESGDRLGEATALNEVGDFYYSIGYLKHALAHFEPALAINKQIGNKSGEFYSLRHVGMTYNTLGNYPRALEYLEKAVAVHKQIWIQAEDHALNALGEVYSGMGEYDQALNYFEEALKFQSQVWQMSYKGYTFCNAANVHFRRGDYKRAIEYFTQALKNARDVKNVWVEAFYHGYMFLMWYVLGAREKARQHVDGLRRMDQIMNATRALAFIKISEARQTILDGALKEAVVRSEEALKFTEENLQEAMQLSEASFARTEAYVAAKKYKKAAQLAEAVLKFNAEKNRRPDMARAESLIASINYFLKDFGNVASHAQSAVNIAHKCGMKETLWQAHHMLAKVYLKQKKQKQAKAELNTAKEVLDIIINNLGEELKKIYLKREEVKDFNEDLRKINHKSKRRRRK
jgi:serine/threonine protein kinase/tetratricopeptide (TPR) repeat protein